MLETEILSHLVFNEEYSRKVIPYLKSSYFQDPSQRWAFTVINDYLNKYNKLPQIDALLIDLSNRSDISEQEHKDAVEYIAGLKDNKQDPEWLLDNTEKFCQEKAIYNGLMQSIQILDDKTGKKARTSIPTILQDALAVTFDSHIGHDFLDDAEARYDFYHAQHKRVPFDIDILNRVTKGGVFPKTFNVLMGGVHTGKTQFLCHFAASNLTMGKKVLYITLEMAEEEIAKRIDANLLDVSITDLDMLSRETFDKKIENLRSKTLGKLIIKEYPTASAGAANFRHLLHELKLKRKFIPDIIYIDYLNICCSSRIKFSANVGLYTYVKFIAEELRGLAVEQGLPIFTATQTNRAGFTSSDPGMEDTAESFGLPATCDLLWAIVRNDELTKSGQVSMKQLKNRYTNKDKEPKFLIGVQTDKMRVFEVEQKAQENLIQNKPVFDNTPSGSKMLKEKFKGVK